MNTADAHPVDSGDLDVAFVAPTGAPGVSNDVIVFTFFGAVADGVDHMVDPGTTCVSIHNTFFVVPEDGVARCNHIAHDMFVNGCFVLIHSSLQHFGIKHSYFAFCLLLLITGSRLFSSARSIRVVLLCGLGVFL